MHLEKAERIGTIDPEMAIFRVFTAEEEAATSVFFAVKQRGYQNAGRLKHRNHTHKQALFPFLMAIKNYIAGTTPPPPPTRLLVKTEGSERRLTINLQIPDGMWVEPQPPLHFSIVGIADGRRARFGADMKRLAQSAGQSDVQEYLETCANLRNQLLYASEAGVPEVRGGVEDTLVKGRSRVLVLLKAVCLIYPYREHSLFVQQALDAFLVTLGSVREEELAW